MTPAMKAVAMELLETLSDIQSNAGCNDFCLAKFVPDVEERRALMKQYYDLNGSPEDYEQDQKYGRNYEYCHDFMMTYLLKKVIEAS
jgi:hypothetical protein